MAISPRTYLQALEFAQTESAHETEDWTNYCQRFVRSAYGIPALFSSAWTQWLGADEEDRYPGGKPEDAPLGAALCYKGSGPYGHIMLAARPFENGAAAAWSNDLVRSGDIDKVARTAPTTKWGQAYLGYLTAVCDYDLQLREAKPPKPKLKRYAAVKRAIDRMDAAIDAAIELGEKRDAKVLRAEKRHLVELYETLKHR